MSNYYTKTAADGLFATIASLSNYVTGSALNTILLDYITATYLAANYFT
jgi:hypothetical protein